MNRKLLVALFVVMSVAVVACKREAPVATPETAPETPAPAVVAAPVPATNPENAP